MQVGQINRPRVHYDEEGGEKVWHFGAWAQLETLLHEQIHLWQQDFGEHPVKPGRVSHNKEFVAKCESYGLHPMPTAGCHIAVEDGPFAQLLRERGIPRPEDVPTEMEEFKKNCFRPTPEKGRSSLHKWDCPNCGLSVRIGANRDPRLVHDVCSELRGEKVFLVQHDGLRRTIFKSK